LIYWIRFLQNGWTDCQSNSNNVHKSYYDNTAFDPVNDTVSINNNPALGEVLRPVIGWTPSPDKGTAGYIIYRYSQADGKFIPIDTIPSDSTYYIDKNVFACASPYTYALASIDSCGKVSPGTFIFAPHTITLNVDPIDPCERVANLSWNAYENMPGGLAGYRVYRQENNNPMVQLADVPPGHTTFTDNTGFRNGRNYKYMVRAYSATGLGTSTSCTIQVTYTGPVAPDTLYIEQASVVDDSYIRINCYSAPYGSVSKLVLERADPASGGSYLPVDTLVYTPPAIMPQHVAFNDSSVNVDAESYTYRLRFIDTCQSALPPSWSNSGSSILLNCMPNSANGNDLEWNDYSEWINPVLGYDIYRTVDKVPDPVGILAAVGPSVNSYTDPLEESLLTSEICYYIKASEAPGNPVVPDAASTSNTACALRDPAVFVPSAFAPYGQNRSFKPVVSQIAPRSFYMRIYNKWGQMIFETYDQRYGWNGKVDGVMSSCDVYAYYITYRSGAGREYAKRGTFVLVK
jgi:hypothetical protein